MILFLAFAILFSKTHAATPADFVVADYIKCVKSAKVNEAHLLLCAKQYSTITSYKNTNDKTKLWVAHHMTPESVSCDKRLLRTLGLNKPKLGTAVCYKLRSNKTTPARKMFFVVQGDRISDLKIF